MSDNNIHLMIGRLEGKVDMLIDMQKAKTVADDEVVNRVSALERERTWAKAVVATVSALVTLAISTAVELWKVIHHG